MQKELSYENYPPWMVATTLLFSLSTYALGAFVLSGFGSIAVSLYLAYCVGIEFHVMYGSCRYCYYYGKTCALGRGRAARLFFSKGPSDVFTKREISWTALVPDFMVTAFPVVGGIALLLGGFQWLTAIAIVTLLLLATVGNAAVRGSIICKYCKQRCIGCPAQKMFEAKASGR